MFSMLLLLLLLKHERKQAVEKRTENRWGREAGYTFIIKNVIRLVPISLFNPPAATYVRTYISTVLPAVSFEESYFLALLHYSSFQFNNNNNNNNNNLA